ncbi:hypothetical protein CFN78_07850 [Amycolatopsis antarctica]|uniref:Uncharacterized protein n=1 Tax=Amycolatopsis antarctica TaxID=1854586 RepID=A0A263D9V6_9PSEU|nr:nucleotide disphospho-sugar-binding domain-containing protein [Amycolatopsis antarctica]OZM74155.1 hypothetical protein CFN78_07850 [Amycolatopsis antarctica]
MRVLFSIFPNRAHLYPVVPLAWALQNQGHEVRIAAHPEMNDTIARTGLTALPFGDTEEMRWASQLNTDPDKVRELTELINSLSLRCVPGEPWHDQWLGVIATLSASVPALDGLIECCRQWEPDLVLWDPLFASAPVAARVCGAAHARLLWGQDNIGWMWERFVERDPRTTPEAVAGTVDWLFAPMLEGRGLEFEPELMTGQWTVDPRPDRWRAPTSFDRLPMRWVPFNGGGHVEDWVRQPPSRPRVLLSLGVGGRGRQLSERSGRSWNEIVGRLSELDIELVVTMAADDVAGEPPANVRVVEYVPLTQVLPSCSAVIHHGGDGTALAAGVHGVPQVVAPVPLWCEERVAEHIADQGAGLVVPPDSATGDALADAVSRVLGEPRFAAGAGAFQKEIECQPAPHEVVPALEQRVTRYRR